MVMDSLRYWVEDCHVDGFRFDLAVTLTRDREAVDFNSPFLDAVTQDPVLARVKMISESWDLGQVGLPGRQLPPGLGGVERALPRPCPRLRQGRRQHHRRLRPQPARLGRHLRPPRAAALGERQLHHRPRRLHARRPLRLQRASTTRRTARTTATATTTTGRGTAASRGRPTTRRCSTLRDRMRRFAMSALIVSQGVPMILMGDENGRTQNGNNNAYCQDNAARLDGLEPGAARGGDASPSSPGRCGCARELPLLAAPRWLRGDPVARGRAAGGALAPAGRRADERGGMDERQGQGDGGGLRRAPTGRRRSILINAAAEDVPFRCRPSGSRRPWRLRLDSGDGSIDPDGRRRWRPARRSRCRDGACGSIRV